MAISPNIKKAMEGSSFIRKMFEEGIALKKKYGEENVYDFSLGNPDLEPPEEVLEAVKKEALSTVKARHGYMPNAGYMETRNAMAEKISQEQGVAVKGENIVMSVGAAGAINTVFKAILAEGDEVVVPAPFFVEYRSYAANHGGKLVTVSTKPDFSLDIDAIKNAFNKNTAAVLINSPNNPTGKVYTHDDIKQLAAAMEDHFKKTGRRLYLIADEPYRKIIYDGRKVSPVFKFYSDSVVVSSFAKDLSLPGERLGYVAVNPACSDCEELVAACIYSTRVLGYVNAPAFFQRVIVSCWNAQADYSSYENRRNKLTAIMDEAGIEYAFPEGAFYLFCKVPQNKKVEIPEGKTSDGVFCDHLKKYNILGVPGTGFGRSGYIRLAYCTSMHTVEGCREGFIKAVQEW
jgi:aspartate aminotransferase